MVEKLGKNADSESVEIADFFLFCLNANFNICVDATKRKIILNIDVLQLVPDRLHSK